MKTCSQLIVLCISLSLLFVPATLFADDGSADAPVVLAETPVESAQPEADQTAKGLLLVIPARYTIVQFAFDIAKLRTVGLVAYDAPQHGKDAVIHVWDREVQDWIQIDEKQYETKSMLSMNPKDVLVVGSDQNVPKGLANVPAWCPNQTRLPSPDLAAFVNTLNRSLRFTPKEWKWLAGRYGFKLQDKNAERRRYGRYGKPGEKKTESFKMPDPEPIPEAALNVDTRARELTPLPKETPAPKEQEAVPLPEDK